MKKADQECYGSRCQHYQDEDSGKEMVRYMGECSRAVIPKI